MGYRHHRRNANRPKKEMSGRVQTKVLKRYQEEVGLNSYERWLLKRGLY